MKKILFGLISFMAISLMLNAQLPFNERCASHYLLKNKMENSAEYASAYDQFYQSAVSYALAQGSYKTDAYEDTLYRIPVVFHIVYTTPESNIPDSLVYSQMEVLNEDYNRRNADTVNTRSIFKPVAGRINIEFYLPTTDPDGNPTSGITRTMGNPTTGGVFFPSFPPLIVNEEVKDATTGEVAWPTDKYVNVWVCDLFTGLLGYAYPPDGLTNWPAGSSIDSFYQGVVVSYTSFGRNNPYAIDPSVGHGRTLTHEMGHYLGLRHSWGDGNCTEDDGLTETPDQDGDSGSSCSSTKNTCGSGPADLPDQIENYMDYSDERCQNMFTNQQIAIMKYVLDNKRTGISERIIAGVQEVNELKGVTIYPNVCQDYFNVDMKFASAQNVQIAVYTGTGQLMSQQAVNGVLSENYHYSVKGFAAGVYFVKVQGTSESATYKVVIQ